MHLNSHILAHRHSSSHRAEIERSERCGCFYCMAVYPPEAVAEWIDEGNGGETALCPSCGIDSVIGSASGYPITGAFLGRMNAHYF
ncbi:cytoplasmic protein [Rubricoccus marinus]|uniref:Cytoplasmic protein n=1 Tax=Rubricoccus marinus TaxID=716817 RepID=A0A259U1T3_9BACT|nr:cytoplasmic protein [Rubricoccus marinus]